MKRIYLDYAATTPVDGRVLEAMLSYFGSPLAGGYGNPGSLHSFGQEAIAAVDKSRETIADLIGSEFGDVIFTGSATEANNLALRGTVRRYWQEFFKEKKGEDDKTIPHIISTAIEHESVLETLKDIETRGAASVTILPVGREGIVKVEELKKAFRLETILVSVMYANNEIGVIPPIAEISKAIKDFNHETLFHTDAVQAFQYLDCNVNKLGVDLMTLSAHKIYGPKGVGALYARQRRISPLITGGGQEFGLRSGTENTPLIVGFAKAVELASEAREKERERIGELRDYLWKGVKEICPEAKINGRISENNLPNILNIHFPGRKADELIVRLDEVGIAVSAGSACEARSAGPSHVLAAMGFSGERVESSLRFSFGRFTDKKEMEKALDRMKNAF